MAFQRIGQVMRQEPAGPRAQDVISRPARVDAEQEARQEKTLRERAGKPVVDEATGEVKYNCGLCFDMHFLRVDVPINHPLFGAVRVCPCQSSYATYGSKMFHPSELYHQN